MKQHIKQFGKYVQIRGNNSWSLLNKSIVEHNVIDIVDCTANDRYGPKQFSNAEDIFFRNCNGNMIFFHLDNKMFPKVKNIYLDCNFEPQVYPRFEYDVNVYVIRDTIKHPPYYEINKEYKYITEKTTNYHYQYQVLTDYIIVNGKKVHLITRAEMQTELISLLDIKSKRTAKELLE